MHSTKYLSGVERFFGAEEMIVSKTDLKGHITYGNALFVKISGYTATELVGAPHNLIRHPGMPRAVFKLLWDTVNSGSEIFAYVVNRSKNGDHYWVYAHVTPSFDSEGKIIGFHSNRRCPRRSAIDKIEPIYKLLLEEEARHTSPKDGLAASFQMMLDYLASQRISYEEFVLTL